MNAHSSIVPSTASTLAGRAIIVSLKISRWSGRRLDRKVTDEINTTHNADADAGRFNKMLLPTEALKGITQVISETTTEFQKRSLPWLDKGARIMDAKAFLSAGRWFSVQEGKFYREVDTMLSAYPAAVAAQGGRLGTMYNEGDYPTVEDLRGRYKMELVPMPVQNGSDFRVNMSEAQASHIRADIERRVAEATATSVAVVYQRIAEATGRMVERLGAYKPARGKGDKAEGIFRNSLVENVRDLIDVLPDLNITGDPSLAAMVARLRPLVEFDADTLREDEGKRRDVAAEAQAILDSVADFLG